MYASAQLRQARVLGGHAKSSGEQRLKARQRDSWQRLDVGDVAIGFMDMGQGEPVVLVHAGVFSDWFRCVAVSRALEDFRIVLVRRAGYAAEAFPRHLTLADHARHAAALADELGIETAHWVGHSSSCQIALALALERPELVRTLALLEPAAGGGFAVPASSALGPYLGAALAAFQAGELERAFDAFMRGVCGDGYRDTVMARLGAAGFDAAVRESEFFFRDEARAVLESRFGPEEAAKVRQPVLCVEGGAQPPHVAEMSREITQLTLRLLPQTEVAILPGVGHAMPLEDPDAVAQTIAAFARRHLRAR